MRVEQQQNNYDRKLVEAKKIIAKSQHIPEKGDIIRGAIQDIKGQQVKILLPNNQILEAKLTQNFGFVIGQDVSLVVKDATTEQLILTPMMDEQAALESKLLTILEQADMKPTDQNVAIIKALMQQEMPVSKAMINQVVKAVYRFPDMPLQDIIFMMKHDLPVTAENVTLFTNLTEGNPLLFSQLESIVSDLTETMTNQTSAFAAEITELLSALEDVDVIDTMLSKFESITHEVNSEKVSANSNPLEQLAMGFGNEDLTVLSQPQSLSEAVEQANALLKDVTDTLLKPDMPISEVLSLLDELTDKDMAANVKALLAKPMVEQQIRQSLFLNIEQLKEPEAIKDYFNKLYQQVSSISEQSRGLSIPESMKEEATNVKQGLEFIRILNQDYQFMELPILLNDQLQEGRLYVLNNKTRKREQKDSVSVLMQLDFLNLKHLDIYINKQGKQIDIDIYTSTETVKKILEKPISSLSSAIADKGYQVRHLGVQLREKKVDIRASFLEMAKDEDGLKQMSFDIRV